MTKRGGECVPKGSERELFNRVFMDRLALYQGMRREATGGNRKQLTRRIQKLLQARREMHLTGKLPVPSLRPTLLSALEDCYFRSARTLRNRWYDLPDHYLALWRKCDDSDMNRDAVAVSLWNRLVPAMHKKWAVLDRVIQYEKLRATSQIYFSYSGDKPYKLALVMADGSALRIELDSNEKLGMLVPECVEPWWAASTYMRKSTPNEFATFLESYEREHKLSGRHLFVKHLFA
ncbi:MAG: hypothetical protein ABI432_04170 [Flavobacteriales bacterium]